MADHVINDSSSQTVPDLFSALFTEWVYVCGFNSREIQAQPVWLCHTILVRPPKTTARDCSRAITVLQHTQLRN